MIDRLLNPGGVLPTWLTSRRGAETMIPGTATTRALLEVFRGGLRSGATVDFPVTKARSLSFRS